MITVTTITPAGKQDETTFTKIREAGKMIAYRLADNTGMDRREGTQLAMQAERTGHAEARGYAFTITR